MSINDPYYWHEQQAPSQAVEHPHAAIVLVLGALSIFCFGVLGPVAWVLGKRALDQIEESGGALGGRSQVLIGYVLGIIGTVLMVLWALLFVLVSLRSAAG